MAKTYEERKAEQSKIKPLKWDRIVIDELGKKIVGEIKTREAIYLNSLGCKVVNAEKYSFNVLASSGPSAGKDYVITNVLSIFNPYAVLKKTRLSSTALNYWKPWEKGELKPDCWDEKILYLTDVSNELLNSQVLKQMMSDGSSIVITNRKVIGNIEEIEIEGNPVMFLSTANSLPSVEMQDRLAILSFDESDEQTKFIKHFIPSNFDKKAVDFVRHLHPCNVKITKDMQDKIADAFPNHPQKVRRNFHRFLDYVRAVAVHHQKDRKGFNEKTLAQEITAEWKDYDIAKEVFMHLHSQPIRLDQRQKEIVEIISKSDVPLEVKEIHNNLVKDLEIRNLRNHLKNLSNLGILQKLSLSNAFNVYVQKYTISEEFKDNEPIKLPNSKDIRG